MAVLTLIDIVKMNESDPVVGLIDETVKVHPEIALLESRTIRGIAYKALVRKTLGNPATAGGAMKGSFRSANAGTVPVKAVYENKLFECFILNPLLQMDMAVAAAHEDGPEAAFALEASGAMEGEWQGLANQFYYGTDATYGNANGCPGLLQQYDATNRVIDATGTTESTCSSVWLVRSAPQWTTWIWGQNGNMNFRQPQIIRVVDPNDSTKFFDAMASGLLARPGLQVGQQRGVVRIKKLTGDTGKGLTDSLLQQALALFPAGLGPNHIFMSQRSGSQLQRSRTATNPTGAPAPYPREYEGLDGQPIPLHITEAIVNTETIAL